MFPQQGSCDVSFQRATLCPSISPSCLGISTGPSWPKIQSKETQFHNWKPFLATKNAQLRLIYPPLLGVFSNATFIDSRRFPLHWVSTLSYEAPSSSYLSPNSLPASLTPNPFGSQPHPLPVFLQNSISSSQEDSRTQTTTPPPLALLFSNLCRFMDYLFKS